MPKSLADAKIRLDDSKTKVGTVVSNVLEVPITALEGVGVLALMCFINKADYALGATGQDTVDEIEACKKGKGNAPGPASYEGLLTAFAYRDADGNMNADESKVFNRLGEEGSTSYLYEREGKPGTAPWAVGDEGDFYEAVLGVQKPPSDRFSGYEKRTTQLFIQDHMRFKVVAGS